MNYKYITVITQFIAYLANANIKIKSYINLGHEITKIINNIICI